MGKIVELQGQNLVTANTSLGSIESTEKVYPVTHVSAIYDDNGNNFSAALTSAIKQITDTAEAQIAAIKQQIVSETDLSTLKESVASLQETTQTLQTTLQEVESALQSDNVQEALTKLNSLDGFSVTSGVTHATAYIAEDTANNTTAGMSGNHFYITDKNQNNIFHVYAATTSTGAQYTVLEIVGDGNTVEINPISGIKVSGNASGSNTISAWQNYLDWNSLGSQFSLLENQSKSDTSEASSNTSEEDTTNS